MEQTDKALIDEHAELLARIKSLGEHFTDPCRTDHSEDIFIRHQLAAMYMYRAFLIERMRRRSLAWSDTENQRNHQ